MVFRWRIYYGDGSVYDNRNGPAWEAPALNVQVVINADGDGEWTSESASDYYWYEPEADCWMSGDIFGLWDYLSRPGAKRVLFGRILPLTEYRSLLRKIWADPDIPSRSAWKQGELPKGGI